MQTISADQLLHLLDEDDTSAYVLDVREPDEFESWRIPGAVNVPVGQVGARRDEVPRDRLVVTVCAAGTRAAVAAGLLEDDGFDAAVLDGGMASWSCVYDEAAVDLGRATVVQVRRRGKGCLSYLLGADTKAVVFDPSGDLDEYVGRATERGWTITHVVDTHLHADHLSGARALAERVGAQLLLSPLDGFEFPHDPLVDGMAITVDEGVELSVAVLATPGHTKGSSTFRLGDEAVFTGDVLFLESVGRPDLADQAVPFAHALFASLHDRILSLPDDATVFPAHAGSSVEVHADVVVGAALGALRESLWQLSCGEDEFVQWATSSLSERPPNYATIVEMNRVGSAVDATDRSALEAGPNRCAAAS